MPDLASEDMKIWMLPLWVSVCACVGDPSTLVHGAGPVRGRLEQSLDSASSACRQNPAYCTAVAGEETVFPIPVSVSPRPTPPQAATPDGTATQSKADTTELSPEEIKRNCNEEFTQCLETPVQSIRGPKFDHSQCVGCRDLCMQRKGIWPSEANGKPCP
jgi:hypothetical protein